MTRTHHASHDSSTREVCLILFKRHVDSCFQYKSDMKHKGNNTMTLQYTTSVKVSHHHVYSYTLCFIRSRTNISPTFRVFALTWEDALMWIFPVRKSFVRYLPGIQGFIDTREFVACGRRACTVSQSFMIDLSKKAGPTLLFWSNVLLCTITYITLERSITSKRATQFILREFLFCYSQHIAHTIQMWQYHFLQIWCSIAGPDKRRLMAS